MFLSNNMGDSQLEPLTILSSQNFSSIDSEKQRHQMGKLTWGFRPEEYILKTYILPKLWK